jgi:nicotinamidase/pyrazinamidase
MDLALLVIDVQNDFCEGGVLAARGTSTLINSLNETMHAAATSRVPVSLTRDWHPPDHGSFVQFGGPWPPHCVQGSRGAEFADGLAVPTDAYVVNKGMSKDDDGYSMFVGTTLSEWLENLGIDRLAVCGIATEYCVLESVRDAIKKGLGVVLLEDLIRPIEQRPGDAARAISEMRQMGVETMLSRRWLDVLTGR